MNLPTVPLYLAAGLALVVVGAIVRMIFSVARARRVWREVANRTQGRCERCGYDVRATPDRCPECGHVPGR